MVGLFGTVFGMIKAFNILGIAAGQPRPDQLAAAISIALITTFWGLLVAIPALVMHGIFRARLEEIADEAAVELENLFRQITLIPASPRPFSAETFQPSKNLRKLVKTLGKNKTRSKAPLPINTGP